MSLTELWKKSPEQVKEKHVQQIIAFAGSGKLHDGSNASTEFREYLASIPSGFLAVYAEECLTEKFEGSGLALQDIINQIGKRLGFNVLDGRYRGIIGQIGFDGLWISLDGDSIVIEVKTTDAYRIDLERIAEYRRNLIKAGQIREDKSSILIVVGREDTGGLEAQVRGSRHAWDVRLISIEALVRLLFLKEEIDDPSIVKKICDILIPREFTKVDGIIDIVFSTAEEVRQEEDVNEDEDENKSKFKPANFNDACVAKIESYLKQSFVKRSKATYLSPDESVILLCKVSREYHKGDYPSYWYAFHRFQKETLSNYSNAYVAFGCGSEKKIILIPFKDFESWLNGMNITQGTNKFYWHVSIFNEDDEKLILHRKKGSGHIDITKYLVK